MVGGEDVPTALLDFARGANATQLVLGTSRRSRLARMFVEGVGTRVAADSGSIDVHMVTHDEAGRGLRLPALHGSALADAQGARLGAGRRAAASRRPAWACSRGHRLSTDVVLYFLATVVAALVGGLGPAFLAALLGGLLLNFFLTPPLYSLHDRRAGERRHARRDGGRRGAGGARRRPGGPAGAAGRAGARGGGAARLVRPHGAHPHRPAAAAVGEGARVVRAVLGGAPRTGVPSGAASPRRARSAAGRRRTPTSTWPSRRTCTSSAPAARWPRPTGACWRWWAARRCWRCAASARRRRPRSPDAAPRPPRPAARCCRRWGTTCAARSRRSRWPPRSLRDPRPAACPRPTASS